MVIFSAWPASECCPPRRESAVQPGNGRCVTPEPEAVVHSILFIQHGHSAGSEMLITV